MEGIFVGFSVVVSRVRSGGKSEISLISIIKDLVLQN